MSPLVLAVIASALVDGGGTAIALDDGTVWMVHHGETEELGGCDDGAVIILESEGGELIITCSDETEWTWSLVRGWAPRGSISDGLGVPEPELTWGRSWWPLLELGIRIRPATDASGYEGWVRLRWDL